MWYRARLFFGVLELERVGAVFWLFECIESVERRVEREYTGVFWRIAFLKSQAFILRMCSYLGVSTSVF